MTVLGVCCLLLCNINVPSAAGFLTHLTGLQSLRDCLDPLDNHVRLFIDCCHNTRRQPLRVIVKMAEAADSPQHRFFCHCCKRETNPKLPDFVCPRCDSDFIEEVTEDSSFLQNSTSVTSEDSNSLFSELWQLLFMERSALLSHPPSSESNPDDSEQVSTGQSRPSPVLPGVTEEEEQESPSQLKRSSRPEQRPAVEGCVDMVHRNINSVCA